MTRIMWGLIRKDGRVWAVYPSRSMARRISKTYYAPNEMKVRKVFMVII